VTANMPAQPLPKSNASPALASFITVSKFADGLPLYRQEDCIALPCTTMAVWMIKLGDLVTPLINLMHETQLAYDILQMDKGYLQSNAYAGYDAAGRRDGVIHVGCLDHARRKSKP
jgi:transposase